MYISKVELKNIKCFEHFSIDLEENGDPILWTMIVGDNSVGKSCLLNSIALGLCDEATAAALMKEISGDFLRFLGKVIGAPYGSSRKHNSNIGHTG